MRFEDLKQGDVLDLGTVSFSAQEIMEFARVSDPMPFHVDPEAAARSPFKALIASGMHPFHVIYLREWAPRFKDSVFAGRGITDWKMHAPVYAGDVLSCRVEIRQHEVKASKGLGLISWYFTFHNQSGVLAQELTMVVFHQLRSAGL